MEFINCKTAFETLDDLQSTMKIITISSNVEQRFNNSGNIKVEFVESEVPLVLKNVKFPLSVVASLGKNGYTFIMRIEREI